MKTEVTTVAENEVQLAIEVPADDVQARIEHTIQRLRQETSMPGFRKGHVPRDVIVQRLGEDYVLSETLNDCLPEWYTQAVIETEIDPVSSPEVDFDDFKSGEPFAFTAKVQVRPEPVLGDYKGIEVPKPVVEVTDAQVEAQLAMLQERLASLKPVEGRALQEGDFAEIDFAGRAGGELIEGASAEGYMLQVGRGMLIPGFEEALVGMQTGDETSFDVTFPDDYREEELAGKPATFTVKVGEIKEKDVPPLDDDFAKQVSEFDTLAELRDDVRTRLQTMQETNAEREFRARVVGAVVDATTVAVPSGMVDRQAHALVHELEHTVGERGMEMKDYLEAIGKTEDEVEEELRPRAEAIVKQGLTIAAVRDAENIEVGDDEVREWLQEEAKILERDPTQHVLDAHKAGRHEDIRAELVFAKTVDFLVDNAVAVDEPAAAGHTEDDAAGGEIAEGGD